MFVDIIKLLIL